MSGTIAAIASPAGTGAVSLIRLSGAKAFEIAGTAIGEVNLPAIRRTGLRRINDDRGVVIDEGILVCFRGPRSYTGEDVVEFTGHGGIVVTRKILERLIRYALKHQESSELWLRLLPKLQARRRTKRSRQWRLR